MAFFTRFLWLGYALMLSIWIPCKGVAQAPNVLLIIADDMGVDALNGYGIGTQIPTTPHLDSLRANGIQFLNAWAYPACTPTRAALMTGKYGIKTGITTVPGNLSPTFPSIFNRLTDHTSNTVATSLIGKWHLSMPANDADRPLQHGMDAFMGTMRGGVDDYVNWDKAENGTISLEQTYATTYFTQAATAWKAQQTQPWFMWLAHVAPHSPYHIPPDSLYTRNNVGNNRQQYYAMIEALDYELGRLFDSMSPAEKAETLVIFVGDNGTPNNVMQGYPSRHGKGSLYEGGIRVPLIISGKGVTRKGETDATMVSVVDLHATILEAYDSTIGEVGGVDHSLSFYHLLNGNPNQRPTRRYNYMEYTNNNTPALDAYAIREARYKLIVYLNEGREEFFDLLQDPLETTDLKQGSLTAEQMEIIADLKLEAETIRTGWSCRDFIKNGVETAIDCYDLDCRCNQATTQADPKLLADAFRIYPNPATGQVTVVAQDPSFRGTLRLLDMKGSQIEQPIYRTSGSLRLSTDQLAPGIYILEIRERSTGTRTSVKLFIR